MNRRILLVEDNPHNIRLVEQLVEEWDESADLLKAESGEAALNLARDHSFDLVLMDISLPDMDGIDVTRALKAYPHAADIPYIVVTAHAMRSDEELFRSIFDDYISKPIDDEAFFHKLSRWMGGEPQ
ncbi:response regulator [Paenibacillus sp. HN-1]|uniref:response regulator n=1 Tax=Paenibacillus TaxID=44249 RepID=UPI001CA93E68|nr:MULTISPECIES: response regulator [Paenibacillus]MBY9077407.1 response regulator [Paenibacillus sp. CGMCC 1.18879]MBY9087484.1 response regulator [Paenibacillus sinensis]